MINPDAIGRQARLDLTVVSDDGREDLQLWEHSVRVTNTARRIARFPGVCTRPVDEPVLLATGLYHDAGWAVQVIDGAVARDRIGLTPTTPVQRELGAALMEARVRDLLPAETIMTASSCIRMLSDHSIEMLEAQLVAEADSLDDFGAMHLWRTAIRHSSTGKTIDSALAMWETQKRYGFWSARINRSFHFEPVRRIAMERLRVFDALIHELGRHHNGADLLAVLPQEAQTDPSYGDDFVRFVY